ncbi:copper resistance protein NlpE [Vibrio mytili]|uniref:Lipoprotein n=1 Tax=Vibrio mytili TaxID=50718 RepID=A0A0C3I734_9VIBR|nr:copper resistance protein NlpE [Vibrio mytili]KIN10102.1 lipoprotein [Vibrio mytili]
MKKTMLALTGAVIILAGCQDEKPAETVAVEAPQASEAQVANAQAAEDELVVTAPVVEEKVTEDQGITPETFVDSAHNASNSLDWNGTYKGTLPCADCSGIDITLTLNQDGTYVLEQSYQEKDNGQTKSEGSFTWGENGSVITLNNETAPNQYFVGENVLMKLDINGEKVSGEMAPLYNLSKQQ